MTKLLTDRSFLFIEERKCSNCCKMFNHFCNTVVVSLSVFACKSLSLVTWSLSWFSINTAFKSYLYLYLTPTKVLRSTFKYRKKYLHLYLITCLEISHIHVLTFVLKSFLTL